MSQHNNEVSYAKKKNIQNWKKFTVFTEVKDCDQSKITATWVITKKDTYIKVRLIEKMFQEQHDCPIDLPIAMLQIMLPLPTMLNFSCEITDV